jgi:hypothetical protein
MDPLHLSWGAEQFALHLLYSLTHVLHVPNFPVDLLSVSSITKSLNCRAWFEPKFCVFQDLKTGKVIGTRTERDGLYYLDNGAASLALVLCSSST